MDEIVAAAGDVSRIIAEIAEDLKQQMAGVRDAARSMDSLGQLTRSNAAQVRQSAEAAERVVQEAEALAVAVSQFRLEGMEDSPARARRVEPRLAVLHARLPHSVLEA